MIALLPPIVPPSRRATELVFHLQPVTSRYERGQFVGVARHLYRGDRRWLPPVASSRQAALRPDRNPLLRAGDLGAFLGVAHNLGLGDEIVGAIAAWRAGLSDEPEEGAWGRWSFFDAMNAEGLVERLFYEAENWLFEHTPGLIGIRGPDSLEPLTPPGLLTDGFDAPPAAFLPYNLPYYPETVEGQGYEPGERWSAYALDLVSSPSGPRVRTRPAVTGGAWDRVSWAYSAGTEGAAAVARLVPGLAQWLEHLSGKAPFRFNSAWEWVAGRAFSRAIVITTEEGEGELAACFGVPDLASALRASRGHRFPFGWLLFEIAVRRSKRLRVFPAVLPEESDARQLVELYETLVERAVEGGYQQIVVAPVPEDDERAREALSTLGARPVQQFTIYEKQF